MKNCRSIRKLFNLCLSGELTEQQRKRLEKHLAQCFSCQREWEIWYRVQEMVQLKCHQDLPAAVWSDNWREIEHKLNRKYPSLLHRFFLFPRFAWASLLVIAVVAVCFAYYLPHARIVNYDKHVASLLSLIGDEYQTEVVMEEFNLNTVVEEQVVTAFLSNTVTGRDYILTEESSIEPAFYPTDFTIDQFLF